MQPGRQRGHLAIDVFEEPKEEGTSTALVVTTYVLTFLSYFFFAITLPITYWFFVKKMGEFDRVVVFRLGKMVGVKGPGRVIIFPCKNWWIFRTFPFLQPGICYFFRDGSYQKDWRKSRSLFRTTATIHYVRRRHRRNGGRHPIRHRWCCHHG